MWIGVCFLIILLMVPSVYVEVIPELPWVPKVSPGLSLNSSPSQASAEDVGRGLVRERVHRFLTDLCCSLKHGINFYDASLGTSGRCVSLPEPGCPQGPPPGAARVLEGHRAG